MLETIEALVVRKGNSFLAQNFETAHRFTYARITKLLTFCYKIKQTAKAHLKGFSSFEPGSF